MKSLLPGILIAMCLLAVESLHAENWTRFRGPNGNGVSADTAAPTTWSDAENLKWRKPLPGKGSSSPIVFGDRVFVTCWSDEEDVLQRQLVCVDRDTGKAIWTTTVDADQPEDGYQGYLREHGYASNTPVTDGERIYAFFGKTGVLAFDWDGNELWRVNVGKESSEKLWGSASSLILYKDTVIVNASEESRSLRALDKATGKEVWNTEADSLHLAYGTPTMIDLPEGGQQLVLGVPEEVWGINPQNGKLRWFASTRLTGNLSPSIVAGGGAVYVFGGYRSSGSHAIKLGGKGDVTESHMLWESRNSSYVATPLYHDGYLYWVDDRGQAYCVDAKTGDQIYRERLKGVSGGGRPFYASPVLVGEKLYVPSRYDGTFVFAAIPEFEQLAQNQFESDDSDCSATLAVSNGAMFLRSNEFLYCVSNEGK